MRHFLQTNAESTNAIPPLTVNGVTVAFVRKEVAVAYLGSIRQFDRMYATRNTTDPWLRVLQEEGERPSICALSLVEAARRLLAGDRPPLLPSEVKTKNQREALRKAA